jgi:hypothetical protein
MAYSTPDTRAAGYLVSEDNWNELVNNFLALNSFFRQELPLAGGIAPLSGVAAASLSLVESSGAGTAKPVIYMLSFDDSTDEGRMWVFRMPRGFGVTAKLVGSYKMGTANTSEFVVLGCQVAGVSDGDTSHSAKVFDTVNTSAQIAVPDAADTSDEFSITLTNFDSIAADDWVCLILFRDADNGDDDAEGDFQLTSLAVDFDLAT